MNSETDGWSDLPEYLLVMIAERVVPQTHGLRLFRAVCSSWRSSLPAQENSSLFPIKLPFPIDPNYHINPDRRGYFSLTESPIYHLQPPPAAAEDDEIGNDHHLPFFSKAWLVRLEETPPKKISVAHPLITSESLRGRLNRLSLHPNESFPEVLNLLNFRVTEVSKAYRLEYVGLDDEPPMSPGYFEPQYPVFNNLVMAEGTRDCEFMVADGRRLWYLRLGDKSWTKVVGEPFSYYCNIVHHKGKFYAADLSSAKVMVMDSGFKVGEIEPPLRFRDVSYRWVLTHLVVSLGNLFLVRNYHRDYDQSIHFQVYKLNDELKTWIRVESLHDRALFVGDKWSFFASTQCLSGLKPNCIYFVHFSPYHEVCVYHLEDDTAGLLSSFADYSQIFWPPPTWMLRRGISGII